MIRWTSHRREVHAWGSRLVRCQRGCNKKVWRHVALNWYYFGLKDSPSDCWACWHWEWRNRCDCGVHQDRAVNERRESRQKSVEKSEMKVWGSQWDIVCRDAKAATMPNFHFTSSNDSMSVALVYVVRHEPLLKFTLKGVAPAWHLSVRKETLEWTNSYRHLHRKRRRLRNWANYINSSDGKRNCALEVHHGWLKQRTKSSTTTTGKNKKRKEKLLMFTRKALSG